MEKQTNAVGRRKEAVTRVFVSKGTGKITINDKDYKAYFPLVYLQNLGKHKTTIYPIHGLLKKPKQPF